MLGRLAMVEAEVEDFLRKALVDETERNVEEEGRRANRLNRVGFSCEGPQLETGRFYTKIFEPSPHRYWSLLFPGHGSARRRV